MQLLSRAAIKAAVSEGKLSIKPLEEELLLPSYYYFRIGPKIWMWDAQKRERVLCRPSAGQQQFEIPPRGYAYVHSLERFSLTSGILGILGQPSEVALQGLRLNYSPTIDPGFSGHLELGLENLLDVPVVLAVGSRIGKVVLFDVSDAGPIDGVEDTINSEVFARRSEAIDEDYDDEPYRNLQGL